MLISVAFLTMIREKLLQSFPVFSYLRTIEDGNERMVDQNSASWNPLIGWLRSVEALRSAA